MRFFSFDKRAKSYFYFAIPQKHFAKQLIHTAKHKLGSAFADVLDLGSGSGEVYHQWQKEGMECRRFVACDRLAEMLECHPRGEGIALVCEDFENFLKQEESFDLLCSSSALQWARNLEEILRLSAQKADFCALSIMTSETLKSFHQFLGTSSPLYSLDQIEALLKRYFEGESFISCVCLSFDSNVKLCEHLRNTGILGGGVLSYSQAKKILEYQGSLEYESLIFIGKSKLRRK